MRDSAIEKIKVKVTHFKEKKRIVFHLIRFPATPPFRVIEGPKTSLAEMALMEFGESIDRPVTQKKRLLTATQIRNWTRIKASSSRSGRHTISLSFSLAASLLSIMQVSTNFEKKIQFNLEIQFKLNFEKKTF